MRKPAEHGNVISSIILGFASIINGIVLGNNYAAIIFWIPIYTALFLYDVPIKKLFIEKENMILIAIIGISSAISLKFDIFLLIPYTFFFLAYYLRIYLIKKRAGFVGIILGLLGYSSLFSFSWLNPGYKLIEITVTLFIFLLGSEFVVRSLLRKNRYLSFYNFITLSFILINPVYLLYSISILRVIFAYTIKKIKIIGILESLLLAISIAMLETFIVLK